MRNHDVLDTELLQDRIMDIEYSEITKENIQKIYLEETGKLPPSTIEVYHSGDYLEEDERNGFNGTIIHFYDKEMGVNQLYTITRGTEMHEKKDWRPTDWTYNLMGVFVGGNIDQYRAAYKFDNKVTKKVNETKQEKVDIELKKIGLGHSLGGNLITLLQLETEKFDSVRTVNPAPPSVYQLANIDSKFKRKLVSEFDIKTTADIYSIDPNELEKFAEDYYKEAGTTTEHTTTKQDILQAAFSLRGFFRVGNYTKPIDVYPGEDVESLAKLFEKLPDSFVKKVQIFLAENLSDVYNEDGFDGLLQELTGINAEVIDSYHNDEGIIKVTSGALGMLKDVTQKVPALVKQILSLQRDLPDVLDVLVEMKYMKRAQADIILKQINGLIDDLNEIKETAERTTRSMLADPLMAPTHLANGFMQIRETWSALKERLNLIQKNAKSFMELIGKGVDAHSLKLIVKVLEKENGRLYTKSGDVLINGSTGGKDIKVNLSSAARIYVKGMAIADRKAEIYSNLKTLYQNTYLDDYRSRQKNLIKKFNDMESNPGHYQYLLGRFPPDTELFYQLTKITVHEQLKPLPQDGFKAAFDNMFAYLEKDIQKTKDLLEQIQEAIEKLFEKDEELAEDMGVLK